MGTSLSKPVEPPPPPPNEPNPMDIIKIMSAKPPRPEEIALDAASGNLDSAIPKTLQLVASDPEKYNISNFYKIVKSMMGASGSRKRYYGKRQRRSPRKQKNKRSRKL